jgi:hypothetical protein
MVLPRFVIDLVAELQEEQHSGHADSFCAGNCGKLNFRIFSAVSMGQLAGYGHGPLRQCSALFQPQIAGILCNRIHLGCELFDEESVLMG